MHRHPRSKYTLYQYSLLITRQPKYTIYRFTKTATFSKCYSIYKTLSRDSLLTYTVLQQQSQQPEWAVCKYTVNQSQHSHPQRTTLAKPPVTSPFSLNLNSKQRFSINFLNVSACGTVITTTVSITKQHDMTSFSNYIELVVERYDQNELSQPASAPVSTVSVN
jgi:hypothetical protein